MPQKQTEPGRRQGQMTVEEAGRLGGHKGGQRVKELIEEGKRAERGAAGENVENKQADEEEDEDGET